MAFGRESLVIVDIGAPDIAVQAARNFRMLRARGIADNHVLLHTDRDFDPFVEHPGLKSLPDLGRTARPMCGGLSDAAAARIRRSLDRI